MVWNEQEEIVTPLQLLTDKPVLYVCNVDEASAVSGNAYVDKVYETVKGENAEVIVLAVATEADIMELEEYEERQMFLEDLGLDEPGVSGVSLPILLTVTVLESVLLMPSDEFT